MSYISDTGTPSRRDMLVEELNPINAGELNFTLFYYAMKFIKCVGINYDSLSDVFESYEVGLDYTKALIKKDFMGQYGLVKIYNPKRLLEDKNPVNAKTATIPNGLFLKEFTKANNPK